MTGPLVSEYSWQGPERGADRAVLLAHGAGSDKDGAALVAVADALAAARIPSLRFNYPYRTAGRKAPDRPSVLEAATREAAGELARRAELSPERLVLGGRSMGGRYCSLAVGDPDDPLPALGLVMLSYPLHAVGKRDRPRVAHFPNLEVPVLFVSGTRDAMARQADLTRLAEAIPGEVTFHWVETADHGYRPLKASRRTPSDVVAEVADTTVAWVAGLGGGAGRLIPV
jgi:predicted alpha/beta-hydrolase family hydrolase